MCSPSDLAGQRPFIQWWSIYEAANIPGRADTNYEAIKTQLLARHGSWKSPYDGDTQEESIFRQIIELGCRSPEANDESGAVSTTLMVLPRYITPRLPYWSNRNLPSTPPNARGRIVLIGDAAHTMPPDVGQGVSCAAEDSIVYALFLKHYLSTNEGQVPFEQAANAYEQVRKPYIHRLLDMAKRNGDMKKEMGWFGEKVRDFAMKIVCELSARLLRFSLLKLSKARLPESLNDYVFAYDADVEVAKYLSRT